MHSAALKAGAAFKLNDAFVIGLPRELVPHFHQLRSQWNEPDYADWWRAFRSMRSLRIAARGTLPTVDPDARQTRSALYAARNRAGMSCASGNIGKNGRASPMAFSTEARDTNLSKYRRRHV